LLAVWWATQTGWLSPDFWLGVSFVVLAWDLVLGDNWQVRVRFPGCYYRLRGFEADGRVYRDIGIRQFKRFVLDGDYMNRWKRARTPAYRLIHTRCDALAWEERARAAETAHGLHLLLLCPCIALSVSTARPSFAAGALALLIGFDLYPVFLQRYNRARIARLRTSAPAAPGSRPTQS
jgi:hypothetical protein